MEENDFRQPNEHENLNKGFKRKAEDLDLKASLLNAPELFITPKGTDEFLDRLSLKIQLQSGRELTLEDYISENTIPYEPKFFKEFYHELARIHGDDMSVMDTYQKPRYVADFKNQFLYGRFPWKVLKFLRRKSPWSEIPGVRRFKLFQHLSPVASLQLDLYIEQAYEILKHCNSMNEFKHEYCRKYRIYFQLEMFTDIPINPSAPTA